MQTHKIRHILKTGSINPAKFAGFISLVLILLVWPLPFIFIHTEMLLFGVPFVYLYIILLCPALILFVTNWAVNFMERIDRNQLETEND